MLRSGATLTVALYVYAKERAGLDIGLCHRGHPDDSHPGHQPGRQPGREEAKEVKEHRAMDHTILSARDLNLYYGENHALKNIMIDHSGAADHRPDRPLRLRKVHLSADH